MFKPGAAILSKPISPSDDKSGNGMLAITLGLLCVFQPVLKYSLPREVSRNIKFPGGLQRGQTKIRAIVARDLKLISRY